MALLASQVPTINAGLVPAYSAAAASDTFVPDGDTFLYVKNTNAATRTIAVSTPGSFRGLALPDPAPTIAATTGELIMGPFPGELYADPTTGLATITPSASAGVSYAVVKLQTP